MMKSAQKWSGYLYVHNPTTIPAARSELANNQTGIEVNEIREGVTSQSKIFPIPQASSKEANHLSGSTN
jgi:hypothetical protein